MGVDCLIKLPPYARVKDVANVMGVLFGLKPTKKYSQDGSYWFAEVEGVRVEAKEYNPGHCSIYIHNPTNVNQQLCHTLFFYEHDDCDGTRLLNPGALPHWQALGKRLVQIFGGTVDFNDCDAIDVDFSAPPDPDLMSRSNEAFRKLQDIIMETKPLTQEDFDNYWKVDPPAEQAEPESERPVFGLL